MRFLTRSRACNFNCTPAQNHRPRGRICLARTLGHLLSLRPQPAAELWASPLGTPPWSTTMAIAIAALARVRAHTVEVVMLRETEAGHHGHHSIASVTAGAATIRFVAALGLDPSPVPARSGAPPQLAPAHCRHIGLPQARPGPAQSAVPPLAPRPPQRMPQPSACVAPRGHHTATCTSAYGPTPYPGLRC